MLYIILISFFAIKIVSSAALPSESSAGNSSSPDTPWTAEYIQQLAQESGTKLVVVDMTPTLEVSNATSNVIEARDTEIDNGFEVKTIEMPSEHAESPENQPRDIMERAGTSMQPDAACVSLLQAIS